MKSDKEKKSGNSTLMDEINVLKSNDVSSVSKTTSLQRFKEIEINCSDSDKSRFLLT
jgi:hypothetical protein